MGVVHDRHQQATRRVGRDADVLPAEHPDPRAVRVERGIEQRVLAADLDERAHDDRERAHARAGLGRELLAERLDLGRVHREERGHVRDLARRTRHLLGDQPARALDRDDLDVLIGGRLLLAGTTRGG